MRALAFAALAASMALAGPADAADRPLADRLCDSLAASVDAIPGDGPAFVASYRPGPDGDAVEPALAGSAFTYDNALAATALSACGRRPQARRIGDALLSALRRDRTFSDGRVRNAYRAGAIGPEGALPPGWWDKAGNHWAEDAYQDGTATGNVAWAGLALMALDRSDPGRGYADGARTLLAWIEANARDPRAPDGYAGGVHGFDPTQARLAWKSTEHNLDVHALATWLGREATATAARGFLDAAFDAGEGAFRLGTGEDGRMRDTRRIALDTQLWPLLGVAAPPAAWRRSLATARERMAVPGGFDFNEDRDGLWVEGTAQAALVLRAVGEGGEAAKLLDTLSGQVSPSGFLFATREASVTTGIRIGPESRTEDFLYRRRPHLGATAWGALAALGSNPFTGREVEAP